MKKIFVSCMVFLTITSIAISKGIETYPVGTANSMVFFKIKTKKEVYEGSFKIISGEIKVANRDRLAGCKVEFQINNLLITNVPDPKKRDSIVKMLKSEDFFHSLKFPKGMIQFTSMEWRKAAKEGEDNYGINANLQLRGITNNVSASSLIQIEKGYGVIHFKFTFDRTKWQINYLSSKFNENLGDKQIIDNVDFDFEINFNR